MPPTAGFLFQAKIDSVVGLIESEPIVQWCRDGRDVPGLKRPDGIKKTPRYPRITEQVRVRVANSLINAARDNYQNKYNKLMAQMTTDYGELGRRIAELDKSLTDASRKDIRRESAQRSCLALADMSILPKSPTPPSGNPTKWIVLAIIIAAIIVASVFTFGAASVAAAPAVTAITGTTVTTTLSAGAAAASASVGVAALTPVLPAVTATIIPAATATAAGTFAGISVGAAATTAAVLGTVGVVGGGVLAAGELGAHSKEIRRTSGEIELPLTHTAKMEQWNYRDTVTVTFDPDSFICTKCTVTQECAKDKNPVFGDRGCKKWKEEVDRGCEDIQL